VLLVVEALQAGGDRRGQPPARQQRAPAKKPPRSVSSCSVCIGTITSPTGASSANAAASATSVGTSSPSSRARSSSTASSSASMSSAVIADRSRTMPPSEVP
jgi:hypothetical protein